MTVWCVGIAALDQTAGGLQQLCRFSRVSNFIFVQLVKFDNRQNKRDITISGLVRESILGGGFR